jgi:hypothetical protein
MAINRDFRDLFSAFSAADVRFLMIGAHAVMDYTGKIVQSRAGTRPKSVSNVSRSPSPLR